MHKIVLFLIIISLSIIPLKNLSGQQIEKNNFRIDKKKSVTIPFTQSNLKKDYYLSFKARIASNWKTGACPALRIYVNGIPLRLEHLVNKGDYFRFRSDNLVPWQLRGSDWTLTYYKWNYPKIPDAFAHKFVFDISKLLIPGKNTILLENIFTVFKKSHIEIKDLEILHDKSFPISKYVNTRMPQSQGAKILRQKASSYHKGIKVQLNTREYYKFANVNIKPTKSYKYPYKAYFNKDNGINFEVNGSRFRVSSKFAISPKNIFSLGKKLQKQHWESCKSSKTSISCENSKFKLHRKLQNHDSHLEISDTFTNKTNQDLPVVIVNSIKIPNLDKLKEFRISGTPQAKFFACTNNITRKEYALTPLIYLGLNNAGVGAVVQDDAYRNQYSLLAVDDTLHIADDMFYLKPKSSYTFKWKLFPTPEKGYYHFLNAVRADWKLYQNIPGLFGFIYPWKSPYAQYYGRYYRKKLDSPDKIKEFFENTGITIPCLTPMYPLGGGKYSVIYGPEHSKAAVEGCKIPSNFVKAARNAGIKAPFLMYTDIHLIATNKHKMLGSNERWQDVYKSTIVRDHFGKTVPYRSGKLYHILPILGSKAANQILKTVNYYLGNGGFDGIFLDEWNQSRQRISYAHSDGMSALLDENYKIKKKVGIIPVLCKTFHIELAKKALAKKAIIFANQFDCTYAASQIPISHFAEPVDFDDYLLKAAQTGRTPLSLTRKRNPRAWDDVKGFLKQGVLTCYYAARLTGDHVLKKVYPITPMEIGPGYVIGRKKIITMLPGNYTFNRTKKLTAYIYGNPRGTLIKKTYSAKNGKIQTIKLTIGKDQVAVILEERSTY
jgi:hypothetical protein